MNGRFYDESQAALRAIRASRETDIEKFCLNVRMNLSSFNSVGMNIYSKEIKEFRNRIDNNVFNDDTTELGFF